LDLSIIFWIVGGLVGFLVLLSLFYAGYVIAPPNQAVVITGGGKQRVLLGEAGWMVPFLSTRNYISVEQFKTDVKTSNFVPTKDFINVKADAAVTLKIGTSEEMLRAAAENFLNWNTEDISAQVTDVLEGNLREIIGQMNLREMVNNRQEFAGKVQENVSPDLAKMGIEVIAFTVQSFEDQNNVIIDLGVDNIVAIKKDAAIARAIAEREEKETKAEQDRLANEARVKADLEISQRQTDLTIKQAELQAKADAEKYKKEREAEAQLALSQREAEAELYRVQKDAEAQERLAESKRRQAEEEAKGIEAKGRAEAEAIRLRLEAEAEGLEKKAEALAKMDKAGIAQMYFEVLPQVVAAAAQPLANVDSITMYGDDNSSKMIGDIMRSISTINEGSGMDVRQLFSGLVGANITGNAIGRQIKSATVEETVTNPEVISE